MKKKVRASYCAKNHRCCVVAWVIVQCYVAAAAAVAAAGVVGGVVGAGGESLVFAWKKRRAFLEPT